MIDNITLGICAGLFISQIVLTYLLAKHMGRTERRLDRLFNLQQGMFEHLLKNYTKQVLKLPEDQQYHAEEHVDPHPISSSSKDEVFGNGGHEFFGSKDKNRFDL